MRYLQHEILDDGAALLAVTDEDGCSATYVFRDGRWFGKNFAVVTEPREIVKLGELFAEGRARQSIDRAVDIY